MIICLLHCLCDELSDIVCMVLHKLSLQLLTAFKIIVFQLSYCMLD